MFTSPSATMQLSREELSARCMLINSNINFRRVCNVKENFLWSVNRSDKTLTIIIVIFCAEPQLYSV